MSASVKTPAAEPTAPADTGELARLSAQALIPAAGAHADAWATLARAHAAIRDRVQEALTDADLPPYQWYELLAIVDAAPEGWLRMSELAEALIMTRGGLTKLFDRLESAGLVERVACPGDRRASHAKITASGRKTLAQMRPVVTGQLKASFVDRISSEEAATIAAALDRATSAACELDV